MKMQTIHDVIPLQDTKGQYGKVYVATDRFSGQFVALKRQRTPSQTAVDEVQFYKALRQDPHPNVMRLLDHFQFPGGSDLCLVFEFMDRTLWDWWQTRRGVAPLEQVTKLVRQGNAGVAHLHELQVVHTDYQW